MNLIVAVDKNWGIGNKGKLLLSLPSDMKFFKSTTTGKPIVYGRKTLASFKDAMPLANRQNIVLSKTLQKQDGMTVLQSLDALKKADVDMDKLFVIGGASVYQQLLPYCAFAFVTKMDTEITADAYFPNLDEMDDWEQADVIYAFKEKGVDAAIIKYYNTNVSAFK